MSRTSFATSTRGLNRDLPPMHLYEKARGEISRATTQVIENEDT